MNKLVRLSPTGIEYGDYAWNFASGCGNNVDGKCRGGGFNCWAYSISQRFESHYPNGFKPTIYPDALLKEAEINSFLGLNCALISDKTNISIGKKDPLEYMKDRYKWTTEVIVEERLQSHLIPINELANGGYEGLSEEQKSAKAQNDFDAFIRRRAELFMKAARLLANGHQLSLAEIYGE